MHVFAHLSVSTSRVQTEDVFTGVSIDSVSLGQYSRKEKREDVSFGLVFLVSSVYDSA